MRRDWKAVSVEDGVGGEGGGVGEGDPGFAAGVVGEHGEFEFHGEAMDADEDGVDGLFAAPLETVGEDFFAPDVLASEGADLIEVVEGAVFDDLGPIFDAEGCGRGEELGDLIEAGLGGGNDGFALLMEEGWEEDEFVVLHFEAAAAFMDAAFAQDEDLFAARESVDDDGPFFEGWCHGRRSWGNQGTMANGLKMGSRRGSNSGACPYCAPKFEAGKFPGECNHGGSGRCGNKAERGTQAADRRGVSRGRRRAFSCLGAEVESGGGGVFARQGKWSEQFQLEAEEGGYFSGLVQEAKVGDLYKLRLDHGSFPDPASRFQPEGPHGPSQVVDANAFRWTDKDWVGRAVKDVVLYEMHLGTFTPEGTWRAAMEELAELARLGITTLEIMPIADFPGKFGWGYDGVNMFAPSRLYGTPDDARAFVNRAHELRMMVILDVVYNHFGPDGNYHGEFSKDYFSTKYKCEWGDPLNFDGENSGPVREFFVSNARYWIDEFHFDGFRFDATQSINDASERHIIAEISAAAREAAGRRSIYMVAENEPQETKLVRMCDAGGCGLDALWNDDYHHSAMVAATGSREAYYHDYKGSPQEFISAAKYGYLYQGQFYAWQKNRRGTAAFDLSAKNFVVFLQNHDQVANSLRGERLHQIAARPVLRALTALTLLSPSTPMLFQGDEFGASAPFFYFADHNAELNKMVPERPGRISDAVSNA